MAKTKISEWSTTPASNTDIDGINIAEGCAPSGINDAIRDLMAQVRSWQSGASGDPFNGPMNGTIGATTAYSGAFTTVSATGVITSTLATGTAPLTIASTTKVTNLNADLLDGADWASPAALGSTTPAAVSATTLSASSSVTLSGGTANGVTYLNGSKVLTSGSALTFNGTVLYTNGKIGVGETNPTALVEARNTSIARMDADSSAVYFGSGNNYPVSFKVNDSEQMRLTSTGLGIGTSSPTSKFVVSNSGAAGFEVDPTGVASNPLLISYNRSGAAYTQLTASALRHVWQLSGTETMRIESTGNVGIGSISPQAKLVVSNAGANGYEFDPNGGFITSYNRSTSAFTAVKFRALSYIFNLNNTTDALSLDSAGNLGLGVTPSAWGVGKGFEVGFLGNGVFSPSQGVTNIVNNTYYASSSYRYATTAAAAYYSVNSGLHQWYTAASGTAGNTISFTQAMTLDASGNLGVGTTSPNRRVEIVSASAVPSLRLNNNSVAGNAGIEMLTGPTTRSWLIGAQNSVNQAFEITPSTANGGTTFTTPALVIDNNGDLFVGNTTASSASRLWLQGDFVAKNGIGMTSTATTGTAYFQYMIYNATAVGQITSTGTVCLFTSVSDYRLKNTVTPMTGALAKVAQLKPVTYKWNSDGSDGQGFIAHELAEVCPDAVVGEKDAVDAEGNIKPQGIDTSFLVATLTAAIQEQQAIIESLKARLDAANL